MSIYSSLLASLQQLDWIQAPWQGRRISRQLALWMGVSLLVLNVNTYFVWPYFPLTGDVIWLICCFVTLLCGAGLVWFIYSNIWGRYQLFERIAKSLKLQGDELILDLNLADGLLTLALARQLQREGNGAICGLGDWQRTRLGQTELLQLMHRIHQSQLNQQIQLETAHPLSIPFPDQTFDLVCLRESEQLRLSEAQLAPVVKEMARVLKPQGTFVIMTFRRFEQFRTLLKAEGVKKCRFTKRLYALFPPLRLLRGTREALDREAVASGASEEVAPAAEVTAKSPISISSPSEPLDKPAKAPKTP